MSKIINTIDICPVCQNPEMEVAHGFVNHLGHSVHIENCPDCGEHVPVLLFTCEICERAKRQPPSIDTAAES